MPKEIPQTTKIDHFGGIGRSFEILERFRKISVFDNFCLWPPNQTNQKKSSAETADGELQSRAGAKEEGGGGKPSPGLGGLGGSDWKGGLEDQKKEDRKEEGLEERRGDLHADPVGRRIFNFQLVRTEKEARS